MIPEISGSVIETVTHELAREDILCLANKYKELAKTQPMLFHQIAGGVESMRRWHGPEAAEGAVRLCMIIYKMVEAQIEVNDLENQHG